MTQYHEKSAIGEFNDRSNNGTSGHTIRRCTD